MSEDPKGSSGAPDENAGGNEPGKGDTVSHETYKKVLSEKKARDAQLSEKNARIAELEAAAEAERQEKLKAQGKFQESAAEWEKKAKQAEEKSLKQQKEIAKRLLNQEVKSVALQMGARPESLEDIIKVGDWSDQVINLEDFSVDSEKVKTAVENMVKSKPYFFDVSTPAPRTTTPTNTKQGGSTKDLSKMSTEELFELGKTLK